MHDFEPLALSLLDVVEFLLHLRREGHVEHFGKAVDQNVGDDPAEFRRAQAALEALGVLLVDDRRDDCRIGGGAADTPFFRVP